MLYFITFCFILFLEIEGMWQPVDPYGSFYYICFPLVFDLHFNY